MTSPTFTMCKHCRKPRGLPKKTIRPAKLCPPSLPFTKVTTWQIANQQVKHSCFSKRLLLAPRSVTPACKVKAVMYSSLLTHRQESCSFGQQRLRGSGAAGGLRLLRMQRPAHQRNLCYEWKLCNLPGDWQQIKDVLFTTLGKSNPNLTRR